MIRYIALQRWDYEGLDTGGYGYLGEDEGADAILTFATPDEAEAWAKEQGWISPKGRRNNAEILAVDTDLAHTLSRMAETFTIDGLTVAQTREAVDYARTRGWDG